MTEGCEFGGGKQIGVISSERPRNTKKTEEEKKKQRARCSACQVEAGSSDVETFPCCSQTHRESVL